MSHHSLQLLLTANKTNGPIFSLYGDGNDMASSTKLHLYTGVVLIDSAPADSKHPLYKIMVARLRLAGYSYASLSYVFGCSENTIRKWAKSLRNGDGDEIARVFELHGSSKSTLSPQSRRYIYQRYCALKALGRRNYRKTIMEELQIYFHIKISGEALRRHFRNADNENAAALDDSSSSCFDSDPDEVLSEYLFTAESDDEYPVFHDTAQSSDTSITTLQESCSNHAQNTLGMRNDAEVSAVQPDAHPRAVFMPLSGERIPSKPLLLHHMGLLLFLPNLCLLQQALGAPGALLLQVIVQFLAGAKNIEQTKLLSRSALRFVLSKVLIDLQTTREQISALSSGDMIASLIRANQQLLITRGQATVPGDVLYYDPHGKHCTGQPSFLKGWCGGLKTTAKVLYADYIHNAQGRPLFMKHYDNFYDLRERILLTIAEFRQALCCAQNQLMTFVVDRGIFGLEAMDNFLAAADGSLQLITWETGYNARHSEWDMKRPTHRFCWQKARNTVRDTRDYHFCVQELPWQRDPRFRKLLVKATNPQKRTVEVAILCSHPTLSIENIVTSMFNRWIQENDFCYLIEHFGIDQLDGRASVQYSEQEGRLNDRQVESRAYRALRHQRNDATHVLDQLILRKQKALGNLFTQQAKKLTELSEQLDVSATLLKTMEPPNGKTRRVQRSHERLTARMAQLTESLQTKQHELEQKFDVQIASQQAELTNIKEQTANTMRTESRLTALIQEGYLCVDTSRKAIMDMSRLLARNCFYDLLADFRPIYNNYRDDHAMLRLLTEASASVSYQEGCVLIQLWPTRDYPTAEREKILVFLTLMSQKLTIAKLWPCPVVFTLHT